MVSPVKRISWKRPTTRITDAESADRHDGALAAGCRWGGTRADSTLGAPSTSTKTTRTKFLREVIDVSQKEVVSKLMPGLRSECFLWAHHNNQRKSAGPFLLNVVIESVMRNVAV